MLIISFELEACFELRPGCTFFSFFSNGSRFYSNVFGVFHVRLGQTVLAHIRHLKFLPELKCGRRCYNL